MISQEHSPLGPDMTHAGPVKLGLPATVAHGQADPGADPVDLSTLARRWVFLLAAMLLATLVTGLALGGPSTDVIFLILIVIESLALAWSVKAYVFSRDA